MWCPTGMCSGSHAAPATPPGRARSGGWCRRWRMMPKKSRTSSARFALKSGLVEPMTAFESFPLGQPAFVTHILDRAAHFRRDDAKLLAMEGQHDARAYV